MKKNNVPMFTARPELWIFNDELKAIGRMWDAYGRPRPSSPAKEIELTDKELGWALEDHPCTFDSEPRAILALAANQHRKMLSLLNRDGPVDWLLFADAAKEVIRESIASGKVLDRLCAYSAMLSACVFGFPRRTGGA